MSHKAELGAIFGHLFIKYLRKDLIIEKLKCAYKTER